MDEAGLHVVFDSTIHGQTPSAPEIDIVAVHGLNFKNHPDHARKTWTKGDKLWLRDFLPTSIAKPCRVMIYVYNSSPAFGAAGIKLDDHSRNLLQCLEVERKDVSQRPLVFICHSLGGLVVKQALVEATLDQSYRPIVEATRLLVFFGTPHQGGNYANVGSSIAKIVRLSSQDPKNDLLDALTQRSVESTRRFEQARHLPEKCLVVNFFEGMPYGKLGIIVDKSSATLNLPGTREKQVALNADHSSICKLKSAEGAMGRLILGTITMEIGRSLEPDRHGNTSSSFEVPFSLQGVPASENFIDRPSERRVLEENLLPRRTNNPRRKVFVLHGLGGIGKTQLAIDFARRHKAQFSAVFWINGRSEDQVRQSLAKCAERVPELRDATRSRALNSDEKSQLDTAVASMLEWLAQPGNHKWLMVFDNVDQDVQQGGETGNYNVREFFPGDHGSILLTSRQSHLKQLGASRLLSQVDLDLSKAIFQQWHGNELFETKASYGPLLNLLQGLPLALAQAAAYIRETGMDIDSYVQLYNDKWKDLMGNDHGSEATLMDYQQGSIATTWAVSLAAIEAKSTDSVNILRLWAFLHHGQFCHDLLLVTQKPELALVKLPTWLRELGRDKIRFARTMGLLLRYSMIQTLESPRTTYTMHPVVHQWAFHLENSQAKKKYARLALILIGFSPSLETPNGYFSLGQKLLPHAERCSWWLRESSVRWSAELCNEIPVLCSMIDLATFLTNQDKFKEADQMLNQTVDYAKEMLGSEHGITIRAVYFLGYTYLKRNKLVEAEEMFNRVMVRIPLCSSLTYEVALNAISALGATYSRQGRLSEAEEMWNMVLAERKSSKDELDALRISNNLGSLYCKQGKLREAKEMFAFVMDGYERLYGGDHIDLLHTLCNIGGLHVDLGELNEAEAIFCRSLEALKEHLGRNHSSTLEVAFKLGNVYRQQSKLIEAERMLTWALEGYQKVLGSNHENTLWAMCSLGGLYNDQDKVKEAIEMWSLTLQACEKVLECDHPILLKTLRTLRAIPGFSGQPDETNGERVQGSENNRRGIEGDDRLAIYTEVTWNLGATFRRQGKLQEAEQMWKSALEGYKIVRPNDLENLTKMHHLAQLYFHRNKLAEAEKLLQQVLEGFEKVGEYDNTQALDAARALGDLYRDQGKLDEAESIYNRALKGYEKTLGEDDARTLWTLLGLGEIYVSQDRLKDAEAMLDRATCEPRETLEPAHKINVLAYAYLGNVYLYQGRQEKTEKVWELALERSEKELGLAHILSLGFILPLGTLYEAHNRRDEAERLYIRCLEVCSDASASRIFSSSDVARQLGDLYKCQGKAQKAERMYKQALNGYQLEFGAMHPESFSTLQSLNHLYITQESLLTDPADNIPKDSLSGTGHSGEGFPRRIIQMFQKLYLFDKQAK